jgi:hypothetical protein
MLRTVWGVRSHQVLVPRNSDFAQPHLGWCECPTGDRTGAAPSGDLPHGVTVRFYDLRYLIRCLRRNKHFWLTTKTRAVQTPAMSFTNSGPCGNHGSQLRKTGGFGLRTVSGIPPGFANLAIATALMIYLPFLGNTTRNPSMVPFPGTAMVRILGPS